jgi:hypothetical protein
MIWFVLYKIPDRLGLISKIKDRLEVNTNGSLLENKAEIALKSDDSKHDEQALSDFIQISNEEDDSLKRKGDGSRNTVQETSIFSGRGFRVSGVQLSRPAT